MRTIHESSYRKRLKMLSSMLTIIPTWLLAGWLEHPSTGNAPDHWTPLLGVGNMSSIGVSRPSHDPAGQPTKHQTPNRFSDGLNA